MSNGKEDEEIKFVVWDEDVTSDDFIGEGSILLGPLVKHKKLLNWFGIEEKG